MKNKKRKIFVVLLLAIFSIYMYVSLRGEYLHILGIGQEYVEIFKENLRQKVIVFMCGFFIAYISTYITTVFIKKGLKKFFEEDKKEMPKLPNKSISLLFGIIAGLFLTNTITQKAILAFNNTWFAKTDPIFGLDIGYFVFQKPFIETVFLYLIGLIAILTLYIAAYYIIVFNRIFDEGINMDTLKKNTFIKQLIVNIVIMVVLFSGFTVIKTQDIVFDKLMNVGENLEIIGAGIVDVTIRVWGYNIFTLLILICLVIALTYFKQKKYKKMTMAISVVPAYLVVLFLLMVSVDLIYVGTNKLDKEKDFIDYNIEYTKNAYSINTQEIELENSGTITTSDIEENKDVINNVNILNNDTVLTHLEEYQTNLGYYTYKNTKIGLYDINGEKTLVYLSPREILSNETRTYNSKTYEYTHGYGVIMSSASKTDDTGHLDYIKTGFIETDDGIILTQPRIYFGMQTNTSIVINKDKTVEYDYPLTSTTNSYNVYDGNAGLNLNFLDRLILGIKEGNLKLAFSKDTTKQSSIITSRNITERAKIVMPYLIYDEEPYMVATDDGELVWVLDAYTVSNQYPYSQKTNIKLADGQTQEINYIRNSAKVLINAYDGTMKFYITDRTDPIIMAYFKMYSEVFEAPEEKLPEDIAKHIVYPKFLYDVQAKMLEVYHDVQAEVLYRADDIWTRATENTSKLTSLNGTPIDSYYTMVKTVDNNNAELGLVVPYTIQGKQNINSYLVGTYNATSQKAKLTVYKYKTDTTSLGTIQLDALIEQDEKISNEINSLNVTGAKITKNIIVVPINNTLLYVEPIYQLMLNEKNQVPVPVLKKVVVASGNKVAIGDNLQEALDNLLSQEAVSIEIETNDLDALISEILKANKNLEESSQSNNWEMIGRDMAKLQSLINQLEETYEPQEEEKTSIIQDIVNNIENNQ